MCLNALQKLQFQLLKKMLIINIQMEMKHINMQ